MPRTGERRRERLAGATRLELATSGVTGRRSNQLNYAPAEKRRPAAQGAPVGSAATTDCSRCDGGGKTSRRFHRRYDGAIVNGPTGPDIEYDAYGSDELAEIYDAVYAGRDDGAFWAALAPAEGGILELACGTGRVLLPLARAGREVVGLDLSPAMLARCRAALAAEPAAVREHVRLVQADMTAFDLGRRFAMVASPFRGFQHLTGVGDQLACLGRCHAHLAAGGRLVLDLFNPDPALLYAGGESDGEETAETVPWTGGRTIRWWGHVVGYHRARQFNQCEMIYEITEADGTIRRVSERFPMRYLFRYELEHLLARAGFAIDALYGDYDRSPYDDDSPELIVVARAIA